MAELVKRMQTRRHHRYPSARILLGCCLFAVTLVLCLAPRLAYADSVRKVDDLLGSVGGTVYFLHSPSKWNGQYWDGGGWKNIKDIPRDPNTTSADLGNGWVMCYRFGGYVAWRKDKLPIDEPGTTFGGFKLRFNDVGVTERRENFDVIIEFTKITAWAPYDQKGEGAPALSGYAPLEVDDVGGLLLAARSEEDRNPTIRSTYRTRFVKRGTDELIDSSNEVDMVYWSIDAPEGVRHGSGNYTNPNRESIWKVSGYKDEALVRQDVDEWLEIVPGEDGIANKGFLSKKEDVLGSIQDNHSMVVLKSGPEFVTEWRGYNCEMWMGYDTVVKAYPEWTGPVIDPPTQVKRRGETAELGVRQTFPHVVFNKAKSVVMSDTLDPALDASKAEVKVYKDDTDVTRFWEVDVSGQTVTAKSRNTSLVDGNMTLKIRVPVSETADLSSYEQQDDQGVKYWKIPNQASTTINGVSKQAERAYVLVPGEATGSVQLRATTRLEGGQLKDGQFTFRLRDEGGNELDVKTNDADGNVVFKALDYTSADIGKTFSYTITEDAGTEPGYSYDTHVETLTVKVEDGGQGRPSASVTYDADGATFVNSYGQQTQRAALAVVRQDGKTHAPLGGAQFTLYVDDGDGSFTSADQPAVTYIDEALKNPIAGSVVTTRSDDGRAVYYGLEWGKTYWLKETTAPSGYGPDPQVHKIGVSTDGAVSTIGKDGQAEALPNQGGIPTITISGDPRFVLPGAGGVGIVGTLLVGMVLVLSGGVCAFVSKRRAARGYR
ncbi:Spy0128 family protein [Olsenella sp. oral taxon 807]|uniref:Spy0128 family protein n=1 Tax=Olsenella sp. oral taxon 807 TaxID=712411 RepID=UPI00155DD7C0|nr:FctA domain-containing protein [Olsenella sp. oral taxon 807]